MACVFANPTLSTLNPKKVYLEVRRHESVVDDHHEIMGPGNFTHCFNVGHLQSRVPDVVMMVMVVVMAMVMIMAMGMVMMVAMGMAMEIALGMAMVVAMVMELTSVSQSRPFWFVV